MYDPMLENYPEEQNEFERLVSRYIKAQGNGKKATLGSLFMMIKQSSTIVSLLLGPEGSGPLFEILWRDGPVDKKHRWRDHLGELRRALILDTLAGI